VADVTKLYQNVGIGMGVSDAPRASLEVMNFLYAGISTATFKAGANAIGPYFGSLENLPLRFLVNNTEVMRVDTAGYQGLGTSAPTARISVVGTDAASSTFSLTRYSSNGYGPYPYIQKARGTVASPTAVLSTDQLGGLVWNGHDGTVFRESAAIFVGVNGAVSSGNVPGAILFQTATLGGGGASSEKMRLTNSGNLNLILDSQLLQFGAGQDATLSYDGTDFICNPRLVGTGNFKLSAGSVNSFVGYQVQGTAGLGTTATPLVITTAKLTPVTGSDGSMTFIGGILTAHTQAT
jgi:hypothetical protein